MISFYLNHERPLSADYWLGNHIFGRLLTGKQSIKKLHGKRFARLYGLKIQPCLALKY